MNIDLKVRFFSKKHSWLCFNHAVKESVNGEEIEVEVDSYGEYYMGPTSCEICSERFKEELAEYKGRINFASDGSTQYPHQYPIKSDLKNVRKKNE